MKRILTASFLFFIIQNLCAQKIAHKSQETHAKPLVNYKSFKSLVLEVEKHRAKRLIDFDTFLKMSNKANAIILDTRSVHFYNKKHIKGAINLPFTEFTQERLREVIPDRNTNILIYCNNNFKDDSINFASKIAKPQKDQTKRLTLALNIPTYLNLYGYGYKSVFELDEFLSILDNRVSFEGTDVFDGHGLKKTH